MRFLHYQIQAGPADKVEVVLAGNEANVMLLDSANFADYQRGRQFRYYGGHFRRSPVVLTPPYAGNWHVVVDLGGAPGSVRASVRLIPPVLAL